MKGDCSGRVKSIFWRKKTNYSDYYKFDLLVKKYNIYGYCFLIPKSKLIFLFLIFINDQYKTVQN